MKGLIKPLHFFDKSSFAYARTLSLGKTEGEALHKAEAVWGGERFPKRRSCLPPLHRSPDPLDETFKSLALTVYSPLLECLEEVA
jgi:hypothetical protein